MRDALTERLRDALPKWDGDSASTARLSATYVAKKLTAEVVAPLLVEIAEHRDARWRSALERKVGEYQECCRDRTALRAHARVLREALEEARAITEDASEMQCRCTGYYRCLGCESDIANRAGEAAEVIRTALAAVADALSPDLRRAET